MPRTLRNLAVTAAVLAGLSPAAPASAAPAPVAPPAVASWRVTIDGTVSGQRFTIGGKVTLHRTITRTGTANGVNRGDVCLMAGFPAGRPATGAIWYGSNSSCFPVGRANLDMAHVAVSGNQITVDPDQRLRKLMTSMWTARPSLSSCLYSPGGGTATYRINADGSLSGELRLRGRGGPHCGPSGYRATLTGVRTS